MGQPTYPSPTAPVTAPLTNPNPTRTALPQTTTPAPATTAPTTPTAPAAPAAPAAPPTDPQQSSADSYNVLGPPQGPNGGYTVQQITAASDQEVSAAQQQVTDIWGQIYPIQQQVSQLQQQAQANPALAQMTSAQITAATQNLDTLYNQLGVAETRLQNANVTRLSALNTAQHNNVVDSSNADLLQKESAKAQADADYAAQQAQVLQAGAPGQRDLVAAQAANAAAQGQAAQATAAQTTARTPAEVAQLQAQANQMNSLATQANAQASAIQQQGGLYAAQAANVAALTGPQVDYTKAQAKAQSANADANEAQAALTTARIPGETGLLSAQTQLAGAQGTGQLAGAAANIAQAQQTQANIQKNILGPAYGLANQIDYIKQNVLPAIQGQVFGPGGSGNAEDANQLLNDYVRQQLGGYTGYQQGLLAQQQFGTQASLYNAAQQAMASRASSLQGAGANIFGTLGQMNANAPAGSTALAGAFRDVLNAIGAAGNQYAPPPQTLPTPPRLPGVLQNLAGTPTAATGPGGAQPMPMTGPAPAPQPMPGAPGPAPAPNASPMGNSNINPTTGQPWPTFNPTPQPQAAPAPQTTAPVTINIGGGGGTQTPGAAGPPAGQNYGANTAYAGGVAPWNAQPQPAMPAMLQKSMPLNNQQATDYVHQLWGNELGSGAVTSPYASPLQSQLPTAPGTPV
jgi:hypothetical protein